MQSRRPLILLLTFATGAAGLIDQVVWQRYLARLFGNDGLATALLLAIFLGGLSSGYALWGRRSRQERSLARSYGWLEATIGLWALLFPLLFGVVEPTFNRIAPASMSGHLLLSTVAAILLIGPPTICMGATVPILTRLLATDAQGAGRTHAALYAVNTLGAVVGALLAGFVLIERLGLPGALRFAALLNLLAAIYFIARPFQPRADLERPAAAALLPLRTLCLVAALSGFAFMTLETLAIRWTQLSLGSSSVHFSLVVGVIVGAIAIGSAFVSRRRHRDLNALVANLRWVVVTLSLSFFWIDLSPWGAWMIRSWFTGDGASFGGYYAALFAALLLLIGLPAALMGATLPLLFDLAGKSTREMGSRAGTLLFWNALGALLGGLIGGYLLLAPLGLGQSYLVAVAATWLAALVVTLNLTKGRSAARWKLLATTSLFVATALLFPYDPLRFAVGTFRLRGESIGKENRTPSAFYDAYYANRTIVAYKDAPEGSFAVVENLTPQQLVTMEMPAVAAELLADGAITAPLSAPRSIVVNGKSDSSTFYDRETLRLSAHLPALFGVQPRRAFVLGLGTGVTAAELTLYPSLERLHVAEISPTVGSFLPFFSASIRGLADDPRYRPHYRDAFRLLHAERERFDLIVSEPSNPWVLGVDQLFCQEFYALAASRLEQDGVLVQWLQRYATTDEIYQVVLRTLKGEFPHLRIFRGSEHDDLIVASRRPLRDDQLAIPAEIRDSLTEIGIDQIDRLLERERALPPSSAGPVETLDHPRIHALSARAFFRGDLMESD